MTERTVAVVQARMGSTRLPGKVMLPLLGEPALTLVLRRLGRARTLDEVVVATTPLPEDDPIVELAERTGHRVVRGSETDVLDRYLAAARATDAGVIVRITSDCPLIDPAVVDLSWRSSRERRGLTRQPARAVDLPARAGCRGRAPGRARAGWREDADPAWREHVTPYIYRHPELFRLCRSPPIGPSAHRWTLDTPEDYESSRGSTRPSDAMTSPGATRSPSSRPTLDGAGSTATSSRRLVPPANLDH